MFSWPWYFLFIYCPQNDVLLFIFKKSKWRNFSFCLDFTMLKSNTSEIRISYFKEKDFFFRIIFEFERRLKCNSSLKNVQTLSTYVATENMVKQQEMVQFQIGNIFLLSLSKSRQAFEGKSLYPMIPQPGKRKLFLLLVPIVEQERENLIVLSLNAAVLCSQF